MLMNVGTSSLQALLDADRKWIAIALAFLQQHERSVAVSKIAGAIQWYVQDQRMTAEILKDADFYVIALAIAQVAEARDSYLIKPGQRGYHSELIVEPIAA